MQGGLCPSATSQLVHYISLGDHGPILQHPLFAPPPWEISGYGPGPSVFNATNLDWLVRGNKCCSIDIIK